MAILNNPNARRLMMLLRANGPMQRLEISKAMGVQPSTVTRIVSQMLDSDIVHEVDTLRPPKQRGFPSKLIALSPGSFLSAGVFINPDHCQTCVIDSCGNVLSERSEPLSNPKFETVMETARALVIEQATSLGKVPEDFLGCGISYPGQPMLTTGATKDVPYMPDWPEFDSAQLSKLFRMQTYPLNDAKSACLAELLFGISKDMDNFCYVWLSHGIGGAAVISKNLYTGRSGTAGEFGSFFPKDQSRPSGSDLLSFLSDKGFDYQRLDEIPRSLELNGVLDAWVEKSMPRMRELCLMIACSYAPDAIVIGGLLPDYVFEQFIKAFSTETSLGGSYRGVTPPVLRAVADQRPQLGAASVPLYLNTVQSSESAPNKEFAAGQQNMA